MMFKPTNKGLRRRQLSALVGAAAIGALTLSACASGEAETGVDTPGNGTGESEQAHVRVSLWGDTTRADLYEEALGIFEADSPGVTTDLEFADLTPYLERMATSAAAGDMADVMFMRDTHIGRYGSAGALLDLSPYLGDIIDTDAIGDTAVADGTIDGGVYALPTHYVGQATLFDEQALADAGISPADLETWSGYAEAAIAMTDPDNGYYGTADPTTGATHRHFESWVRQAGEEVFTADGEIGFTAPTAESWFQFWKDLRDAGAAPPADIQVESESQGWTNDLLVTGRAALRPSSTNHLVVLQELTQNDLGLTGVPAEPNADEDWRFFPPILISVAANTDHPEAAARVVNFLVNSVEGGNVTTLSQGAPSSSAVRDGIMPSLTEDQTAFIEQISAEQELPRRPFPIRPEGAESFNAEVTRAGEAIAYGQMSVEDAVEQLMSNGARVLADAHG